jgi:excisionase family DNA binding protein
MTGRAEYLRAAEIAGLVGISTRTVRRWIADEIIPSVKLGGSRLVARADLERVLRPTLELAQVTKCDNESDVFQ